MSETSTLIGYGGRTIGREELALVPTPVATETHHPIPRHEIVQALIETLGFRHTGVVHDEYAVSPDGMKVFGVLDLATEMEGCRFSIGLRNSHDKSMRLAMTCGYRVFVCSNMAFAGDFTPVLAKHSKSATAEHTWQALAWEANARVAMAELDLTRAQDCIAKGLSAMEGFEVPLASWRVHATAFELYQNSGNRDLAERHLAFSRETVMKLANSLPTEEPLRQTYLSAPVIRKIVGNNVEKSKVA